ncbi:MAG: LamG domain-containing protein [Planctomycetota bacterium]|jgi:hypothetical protein
MWRKTILLISLVLLLGPVSSILAYDELYWDDGDPCDHLWSSPNNWDVDRVPVSTNPATGLGDVVHIESGFGLGNSPIIDANVIEGDPNTGSFVLAVIVGAWNPGDSYLTMTGGYLRIDEGWDAFMLGLCESIPCSGTLNMSGGLIELYGADLFVGDKGIGYLNMTDPCDTGGGIIDTNGGQLALPGTSGWFKDSGTGSGHIDLDAGSIICGSIFMQEPSTIDINEGTLIIEGDATVVVTGYVESGWITGRGSGDPRNVAVVYDDVNDITVVTYDPTPDLALPWRPRPLPGSTDVHWEPTLSWNEGSYADTHTVYFGSSLSDVNGSATPVSVNQPGATYPINYLLEFDQNYYWRIDEVNDACAPYVWPGPIWFFTVRDYVIVDDFDSYASDAELETVWIDKSGTGINSLIYLEKTIVNDGNSMLYDYDNSVGGGPSAPRYAEVWANAADLEIGTDWTGSAKALVMYFYGQSDNDANEQMYVVLEDNVAQAGIVEYDGDMNNIKEESWHEWNIDLQDPCFGAVDTNNIAKVYIGFGVRGNTASPAGTGEGTVYFDDIRVYPTRCLDEFAPAGDITGECLVDYADVNALVSDWLLSDYNIVATAPPNSPVGWWKLDEGEGAGTTAYDSAGSNNGTLGGPSFLPVWLNDCGDPCHSPCLNFQGVGYVDVPNAVFTDVNDQITVTLWQYGNPDMQLAENIAMFHACDACEPFDLTIKGEFYDLQTESCEVYFDAGYGGDTSADSASGLAIAENYKGQWNHYAFTKNANTGDMRIYLNGVLFADQGQDTLVSPMPGTEIDIFKIGTYYDGVTRRFDGYMSDFRIYNYELSYGEVRYVAGQMDDLYMPLPLPEADLHTDGDLNFKDFAVLANTWLIETLWP